VGRNPLPQHESPPARSHFAGTENDKCGQVFRFGAKTVGNPRAHAGPSKLVRSGVHQELAGRLIERISDHGLNDGDVIDYLRQVRQDFGDFRTALPVFGVLELRAEKFRIRVNKAARYPLSRSAGGSVLSNLAS